MPELGGNLLNLVRFPRSSSIFDYSDYIISTTTNNNRAEVLYASKYLITGCSRWS